VPIFAVGCERGVHYYAMRYIEGRTLAAVIDELRRLDKPREVRPLAAPRDELAVTLADVIAFNNANHETEMPYFGQELLIQAEALGDLDSEVYIKALAACRKGSRDEGIDRAIREHKLDAIVAPTGGTAWLTDFINGDSSGDDQRENQQLGCCRTQRGDQGRVDSARTARRDEPAGAGGTRKGRARHVGLG